jgi:glycosyltransferase involved in cell wall biosynthesis
MTSPPPQVSCIISTYNRRDRLLQAIESVRGQEGVPLEILVCDDGSSDGTEEAVLAIADPRVHFLTGPHSGLSAVVRNRGIAAARGEWLAFLDDDDLWRPGKLRAQLGALDETGALAATTNAHFIHDGRLGDRLYHEGLPDRMRFDFDRLVRSNTVIFSSAMIHRSLMPSVRGFPQSGRFRTHEDHALWLRVATLTDFVYLDAPLIAYASESTDSVRIGVNWGVQRARVLMNALRWTVRAGRPPRFALGVAGPLSKHAIGLAIGAIRRRLGSAPAEAPTAHNP